MKTIIFVPNSTKEAGSQLRFALRFPLNRLSRGDFVRAWSSIAYLFPGLHPDGFEDTDSGWPRVLRRFVLEAWRRAGAGDLNEEELYPSDAQWAGLCDRMTGQTAEEMKRRFELTALSTR